MGLKWPKEWVRGIADRLSVHTPPTAREEQAIEILEVLEGWGALKDPPKSREWWFCTECRVTWSKDPAQLANDVTDLACKVDYGRSHRLIRVREVLDES